MSSISDTHERVTQAQDQPFTFQPPAGGDIILKSSDNNSFNAHSIILGMASTVFADIFSGATKADPVELAEDAESVSLMLAFIYPVAALPQITTVDHLEKLMGIAQKYDISRIIKFIEGTVTLGSKLMSLDPMRIFCLSVTHHFPTIQALSAKSLRPRNVDLLTVDGLLQLAKYFPHAAPAIGLAGAQGARIKILDRVLLQSPQNHGCYQLSKLGNDSDYGAVLPVCSNHPNLAVKTLRVPDYCILWLRHLYDKLMKKPMHECSELFFVSSLAGLSDQRCIHCIAAAMGRRVVFEQWAAKVKLIVEKELKALDVLYSL
ncbi:hypothetical protein ACGC1H_004835 [Rhizoctonia solani]